MVVADGGRIPSEEQVLANLASTFQVADLTRPLMSVSQICEQGCQCIFTDTHATIVNREGQTVGRFETHGRLCVTQMKVKAPEHFGTPS